MKPFYMVDKELWKAKGCVSPITGEVQPLTSDDKNIYIVLKDRNEFFTGLGQDHYDTQEDIANLVNVSRRKAGDTIRKFIDSGVVVAEKRGRRNWTYRYIRPLELVYNLQTKERGDTNKSAPFIDDFEDPF